MILFRRRKEALKFRETSVYLGYALNERKNTLKKGHKLIKKHMILSIK